jgi:hypothetical protein
MDFPGSPCDDADDRQIREFAAEVIDRIRTLHEKGQVSG